MSLVCTMHLYGCQHFKEIFTFPKCIKARNYKNCSYCSVAYERLMQISNVMRINDDYCIGSLFLRSGGLFYGNTHMYTRVTTSFWVGYRLLKYFSNLIFFICCHSFILSDVLWRQIFLMEEPLNFSKKNITTSFANVIIRKRNVFF